MVLTSHQSSVGGVLEFGSQLINEGIVTGKEEREIREQMTLLSDRWENLRVGAMERQTKYDFSFAFWRLFLTSYVSSSNFHVYEFSIVTFRSSLSFKENLRI